MAFILAVAIAYVAICVFMYTQQHRLQYVPDRSPIDPPAAAGITNATRETLATPDGERLVVWWAPPADDTKPVYLYLHGNGAHLVARAERFRRIVVDGSGLMAVSWRGYGDSTGRPSEAGLLVDARAAYTELSKRVPPKRIVIFGESLGTTVSVMLASEVEVGAMILDSGFASALDVASRAYPWLPVNLLLRDQYRADLAAPRVNAPTLLVHCRNDPVTPYASAQKLHALFRRPEPLLVMDEACHPVDFRRYETQLRAFVARHL